MQRCSAAIEEIFALVEPDGASRRDLDLDDLDEAGASQEVPLLLQLSLDDLPSSWRCRSGVCNHMTGCR